MKITIEFDSNNKDEMDTVLAALSASPVGKDAVTTEDKAPAEEPDTSEADAAEAKKKADAAAKRKAAAAKKKKEEEEAAAAAAAAEAEEKGSEFSRDDVRAKLKEHAALEGKDAAIQILKDHDAASITELAEDKFADVIAACG